MDASLTGWNTSVTVWQMDLASELVFVGDEGVTEPKGASQRHGLEWSNYITPADGWIVDADIAWSQAKLGSSPNVRRQLTLKSPG